MSRATHATALTRRLFHACSETGDLLPRLFLSEPFFISSPVVMSGPPPSQLNGPYPSFNNALHVVRTIGVRPTIETLKRLERPELTRDPRPLKKRALLERLDKDEVVSLVGDVGDQQLCACVSDSAVRLVAAAVRGEVATQVVIRNLPKTN